MSFPNVVMRKVVSVLLNILVSRNLHLNEFTELSAKLPILSKDVSVISAELKENHNFRISERQMNLA